MQDKKAFKPQQEIKLISQDMIQALADLGYPKEIRSSMSYDEINNTLEKNISYKEKVTEDNKEGKKEDVNIPEYKGDKIHKAAYDLDLKLLKDLVKDRKDIEAKDKDLNTLLHLAVMMAFRDYPKALLVIKFLKEKDPNIFLRNDKNYTPLEIAEQRAIKTPEYLKIVEELKR